MPISRKLGFVGGAGLCAALILGGCAGAGNGSAVLGPTPPTSVSPVSSVPNTASVQTTTGATSPHSLTSIQSWTTPTMPPESRPSAFLAALTAHTEALLILDPTTVSAAASPIKTPSAGQSRKARLLDAYRQGSPHRLLATLEIGDISRSDPRWQASWADGQGKLTASAPPWLVQSDAKTPDLYPVKFWDGDWQKRTVAVLDTLVADGYDGVSLQGIDTFARFQKDHTPAATEMAAFVSDLAAHARKTEPAFSVLVDGGAGLPAALPELPRKDFLAALDGILARDVFYSGDKPIDNDLAPDADVLAALDTYQKAAKLVLVTERLADPAKIADFLARARSKGYLPDAAFASPPPSPASPADPKVADNRIGTK